MSLENERTLKPIPWLLGEGRWEQTKLGKNASVQNGRSVPESNTNRCYASAYRQSGVCGVGMLRRVVVLRGEILICAGENRIQEQQAPQDREVKGVLAYEEVGKVHSSVDAPVMGSGAREPYFVDVNQEGKDK